MIYGRDTPFSLETLNISECCFQVLCEAGCYIDIANKYGVTALSEAALNGQLDSLMFLLSVSLHFYGFVTLFYLILLFCLHFA